MKPRIVAVVPTLGRDLERLQSTLISIERFTSQEITLLVIDNSYEANLTLSSPSLEIIHTGINLGWVGALEYVRRNYECDYLWTIQDDMTLENDVLSVLLQEMESDSTLGVITPVAVKDGLLHGRSRGGVINTAGDWRNIPVNSQSPRAFSYEGELHFVASSGALWRKSALDAISGFDLSLYPVMHTDVDTCIRLRAAGWKLKISSSAHISHKVGGSTEQILAQTLAQINKVIIDRKQSGATADAKVLENKLDYEFLYEITRKSSFLFLDVANVASGRLEKMRRELNNEVRSNILKNLFFRLPRKIWRTLAKYSK